MSLRSEFLDWLAALPAMETPDERRALLTRTGPASLYLNLDWQGNNRDFSERLVDALAWHGLAAILDFLSTLRLLPSLQDDGDLAALQDRLEALDDAEFYATFLVFDLDQLEAAAEEPDESLAWDLPETPEPELPAGDLPRAEPPRETATREAPPPAPPAPEPAQPRRPFESLEGAEPVDVGVDQDVETVEPGGTVTGAVIGGDGPVTVGGQHHHGDQIDTGGAPYYGGQVDVGRDLIGRDQVVHGDQVAGAKYEAGTINIYHGTPDAALLSRPSLPESPLIEEAIRLDVAAPPAATLELPFDLAVAVRQPDAPTLAIEDLSQVKSEEGTVFRREEEEIVLYRVAVAAVSCDVQPPHYILKLRPRANSAVCWFQLTPHRPGKQSIVVTAYQQDDALAAQTRLSIEVQVPVSPAP